MAAANRRENTGLSEQLFQKPYRFDFFQAVRLLEQIRMARAAEDGRWRRYAVGRDRPAEQEVVRFRAVPSLGFPASAISQIRRPERDSVPEWQLPPPEMLVSFMGLTGPQGVLPYHYTALLLRRVRYKDYALRDLLDLFNHRLISLFYRAWEKYRLPFAYERARLDSSDQGEDLPTRALYALVGLGTDGLRGRLELDDEAFLFYSGHFAHYPRSASALESLLEDYFEMPVTVQQLQGQWLLLETGDQARMPSAASPRGRNNRLGVDLVIGERVWDVQSKFRLRLGPLTYAQFCRLMPNGDALRPLCQMTRFYVGPELDFDVQPVLAAREVPCCRLGAEEAGRPYLGWNTWLCSQELDREVEDAVFALPNE